jgi:hypothetical protein
MRPARPLMRGMVRPIQGRRPAESGRRRRREAAIDSAADGADAGRRGVPRGLKGKLNKHGAREQFL